MEGCANCGEAEALQVVPATRFRHHFRAATPHTAPTNAAGGRWFRRPGCAALPWAWHRPPPTSPLLPRTRCGPAMQRDRKGRVAEGCAGACERALRATQHSSTLATTHTQPRTGGWWGRTSSVRSAVEARHDCLAAPLSPHPPSPSPAPRRPPSPAGRRPQKGRAPPSAQKRTWWAHKGAYPAAGGGRAPPGGQKGKLAWGCGAVRSAACVAVQLLSWLSSTPW
jgi:hypothetical protein